MKTTGIPTNSNVHSAAAINGVHVIADMHGCDPDVLNDEAFLSGLITQSAVQSGATVLDDMSHQFTPHGVTAIALLAESHVSIHTWPEIGYAAVDAFTCGEQMDPTRCIQLIADALHPQQTEQKIIKRDIIKETA